MSPGHRIGDTGVHCRSIFPQSHGCAPIDSVKFSYFADSAGNNYRNFLTTIIRIHSKPILTAALSDS